MRSKPLAQRFILCWIIYVIYTVSWRNGSLDRNGTLYSEVPAHVLPTCKVCLGNLTLLRPRAFISISFSLTSTDVRKSNDRVIANTLPWRTIAST